MKVANIDRQSCHISWTTWGISMKFFGKIWLMIILKVSKNGIQPLFRASFPYKVFSYKKRRISLLFILDGFL